MKKIIISALIFFQTSLIAQTPFTGDKKELNQQVLLKIIPAIKVWDKNGNAYTLTDYISNNTLHNGKAYLIIQWGWNHGTVKETMNKIHSGGLADQYNIIALYTGSVNPEKLTKEMTEDLARRQTIDNNWAKFIILATTWDEITKNFFIEDYPNFIFTDNKMNVITVSKVRSLESTQKLLEGIQKGIIKRNKKWYDKETGEVSENDPKAFYYDEYLVENKILHYRFGTKAKLLTNVNYVIQGDEYLYDGLFEMKNEAGKNTALGRFKDGVPVETIKRWYDDGKIQSVYPVNGTCKVFTNNDKLLYEGPIENGLGNGLFTEYDTSGKKVSEANYKAGKLYVKEVDWKKYDQVYESYEGVRKVELNNKRGFVTEGGKEITAIKYDEATDFNEGMAAVTINEKVGVINKEGKEVTAFKYSEVKPFIDGVAKVAVTKSEGVAYGYIDKTGKEIIPVIYDLASSSLEKEFFRVKLKGKWGMVDRNGIAVIPLKYDYIGYFFEKGKIDVVLGNEKFYFNEKGERVD